MQTGIHHHYRGPRPLGMGDAFVAVANDYNALLYNPAGLARLEQGQINMSIDAGISAAFQKFNSDIAKTGEIQGTEAEKTDAYMNLLKTYYGQYFSMRAGLLEAAWVRPNWGIAFIPADFTMNMHVHNTVGPSLDIKTYLDSTLAYGYGNDFKGISGRLSWGVTGKFINRGFASKNVLPLDLAADPKLFKSTDLQEGYTVDADIGVLYTPFLPSEGFSSAIRLAKPTFAAVLRNIGQTGFGRTLHLMNKEITEAPEPLYRVLDVGAKFEFPELWLFSSRLAIDMRDLFHPFFTPRKGFHAGMEFDWRVTSWWKGAYRIGVNQGYPTFGVSALFGVFNLDVVTYGEDIGTYDTPKENRMYMVKLNLDI